MSIILPNAQPGDLITAGGWNKLLALMTDLERRVQALEVLNPGSSGRLQIATLSFPSNVLHMGDELHILGTNLGIAGETTVSFGSLATVTSFTSMTDREIVLTVPAMAIGSDSLAMTLLVNNPRTGADAKDIVVFQAVSTRPDGTILVGPPIFPAGNVVGDMVLTIPIKITTLTMDETFKIATTLLPQSLNATITDEGDQTISQLLLPKTERPSIANRTLKVKFTVPSGMQGPGSIALVLTSERNPALVASMAATPFTLGAPGPVNAFAIDVLSVGSGSYDAGSNTIHAPLPGPAKVRLRADLSTMPGNNENYTISAQADVQGWTVQLDTTAFQLASPTVIPFQVWLTPNSSATAMKLTVSIKGTETAHQSTQVYNVLPG
jgi:hypothetical protein